MNADASDFQRIERKCNDQFNPHTDGPEGSCFCNAHSPDLKEGER